MDAQQQIDLILAYQDVVGQPVGALLVSREALDALMAADGGSGWPARVAGLSIVHHPRLDGAVRVMPTWPPDRTA